MCSSRRRGRRCRSSTDSSVVDRADTSPSRSRHALEGAHTGSSSWDFDRSPRPGASRSSARVELGQSGACLRPPRPSGVAVVGSSSTSAGFRLAWGGLGGVFSRLWPLLVGREVRRFSSSRGSGPVSSTRFGALLYWGASAWFLPLG